MQRAYTSHYAAGPAPMWRRL